MKEIKVKAPSSGTQHELSIKENTTAEDVLNHVDMPDYNLKRPGSNDVNDTFDDGENIYDQVKDGQLLKAGTKSPVGR